MCTSVEATALPTEVTVNSVSERTGCCASASVVPATASIPSSPSWYAATCSPRSVPVSTSSSSTCWTCCCASLILDSPSWVYGCVPAGSSAGGTARARRSPISAFSSAGEPFGQRLGLTSASPGDQYGEHQIAERYRPSHPDEQVRHRRADHEQAQRERGQAGQRRDQRADRAGDFEHPDHVPEPLAHADLVEDIHHIFGSTELLQTRGDKGECQQGLKHPQYRVRGSGPIGACCGQPVGRAYLAQRTPPRRVSCVDRKIATMHIVTPGLPAHIFRNALLNPAAPVRSSEEQRHRTG